MSPPLCSPQEKINCNMGAAVKRAAASNTAMHVKRSDSSSSATRAVKSERMVTENPLPAVYTITAVYAVSTVLDT